jgi:hypothetical protein
MPLCSLSSYKQKPTEMPLLIMPPLDKRGQVDDDIFEF